MTFGRLLVLVAFAALFGAAEPNPENLLSNGDFDAQAGWQFHGSAGRYAYVPSGGRSGACLRYRESGEQGVAKGVHADQVVELQPDTYYVAAVAVQGDGKLRPTLRIATEAWQTLALVSAEASTGWQTIEVGFFSGAQPRVRFQLFGGGYGAGLAAATGTCRFDDALLRRATAADLAAARQCTVKVDAGTVVRRVNPLFFGVNTLFWIEDEAALQDGSIARRLREMPCRLMRFPGGTAAENYHWQMGTLENPRRFPFRGGPGTLNTDALLKLCRQVGAEPIFVVNLETGFVQGHLDAGIAEAVAWVRYCNRERGYHVRYWEIGNEQYLLTNMTAGQYAEAFVRFARAMKQVDPTILVGAIGPERIDSSGPADRIPAERLRQALAQAEPRRSATIKQLKQEYGDGPAWWPTVLRIAGAEMDLAVIHNYFVVHPSTPLEMDKQVAQLRQLCDEQRPGKPTLIALTEWNVSKAAKLSAMELALARAEAVGRFLTGGVDLATFWPLRFPGAEWGDHALLDLKSNAPRPAYQIMQRLASALADADLVPLTVSRPELYALAARSRNGRNLTVFLVYRSAQPEGMQATVSVSGLDVASVRATTLTAQAGATEGIASRALTPKRSPRGWDCQLPPQSLTVLTLEP